MNRPYVASFSHQLISSSSSNETSKHPEKISVIHVFLAKKIQLIFQYTKAVPFVVNKA